MSRSLAALVITGFAVAMCPAVAMSAEVSGKVQVLGSEKPPSGCMVLATQKAKRCTATVNKSGFYRIQDLENGWYLFQIRYRGKQAEKAVRVYVKNNTVVDLKISSPKDSGGPWVLRRK